MKNKGINKVILITLILALTLFLTMCKKIELDDIVVITPVISADPTPSPTPDNKISEDEIENDLLFLGFDYLLNYVTVSQYNYIMNSTQDYFNSLYQSNIRRYQFSKYLTVNGDLLNEKFLFTNNEETQVPFDIFSGVYAGDDVEYKFIFDESTLKTGEVYYFYSVDLYISGEKSVSFAFTVNKNTLQMKIK